MYRLDGYRGDDLLPLLVYEIARKAAAAVVPQPPVVRELWNTVDADRDYDEGAEKSSHRNRDVGVERPAVGGGHVEAHAGLEILGGDTGRAGGAAACCASTRSAGCARRSTGTTAAARSSTARRRWPSSRLSTPRAPPRGAAMTPP